MPPKKMRKIFNFQDLSSQDKGRFVNCALPLEPLKHFLLLCSDGTQQPDEGLRMDTSKAGFSRCKSFFSSTLMETGNSDVRTVLKLTSKLEGGTQKCHHFKSAQTAPSKTRNKNLPGIKTEMSR